MADQPRRRSARAIALSRQTRLAYKEGDAYLRSVTASKVYTALRAHPEGGPLLRQLREDLPVLGRASVLRISAARRQTTVRLTEIAARVVQARVTLAALAAEIAAPADEASGSPETAVRTAQGRAA